MTDRIIEGEINTMAGLYAGIFITSGVRMLPAGMSRFGFAPALAAAHWDRIRERGETMIERAQARSGRFQPQPCMES